MTSQKVVVTIEKMIFGGLALARTNKGVLFVDGGVPGETVSVEVESSESNKTPTGTVVSVLEQSKHRREPHCPYYGVCGGCDWLHIEYQSQLLFKKEILNECMYRIGHLKDFPEPEIISSQEIGYRLRAQFKISNGEVGFFKRKSNDVVGIKNCPLLVDSLNDLIGSLSGYSFPQDDSYLNLRVLAGDNGVVASDPVLPGVTRSSTTLTVADKKFDLSGDSFFQSNRFLHEKLATWALPHIGGDFFVDLYGGTGFFSVFAASKFKSGILVENVSEQVEAAKKNYATNGVVNCTPIVATAERFPKIANKISCLIIDPPRPGLTQKARESIARLQPTQMLYISCNPSTQARDLDYFVNKCNYKVSKSALFDLYPNTHHIESVVLLERV